MSFCDISFKRKQDGIIEVRNKRGEQSPLYSKLVEYTNQNNVYQGREWFFDKLVQQGKLKDTKPNELALGLYSIAYNSDKSESYWLNKIKQLIPSKQSNVNYQNNNMEGIVSSEKTIRDLAARMSDRIGIEVKFESDRTKEYKGKIENGVTYVNLAYATLDTIPHEILSHPIIRALKNKSEKSINDEIDKMIEQGIIIKKC